MNSIELINNIFSEDDEIELVIPFTEENEVYIGEVKLDASPKEPLLLQVEIPKSYPLSDGEISVKFYLSFEIEAAHVNHDNSICIHTPQHHDFKIRLRNEIKLLKGWRNKHYLKIDGDERYDYLNVPVSDVSCVLFTHVNHQFSKGEFGIFKYSLFSDHSIVDKNISAHQIFILDILGYKCDWSESVHRMSSNTGFCIFIEDEPVKSPYKIATNWIEIEPYLSIEFLNFLYKHKKKGGKPQKILMLIGYYITGINGEKECHWNALFVKSNEIPIYGQKIAPNQYQPRCDDFPIYWTKTVNSSYERFFGRGCLSKDFIEKKILIIGVGAIGSGLATILTRSGVRHLDISDYDHVEPGNICRSEYFLTDNQLPKTCALLKSLNDISPFIDVQIKQKISKNNYGRYIHDTRTLLEQYDLVMDCSSDNELAFFIDQLKISAIIANISISNEAKEMLLVVDHNITESKNVIFSGFDNSSTELMYEGTGCWSPTFKATYFDIHSQLNLLVQNMDYQLSNLGGLRTTLIKKMIKKNTIELKAIDY